MQTSMVESRQSDQSEMSEDSSQNVGNNYGEIY